MKINKNRRIADWSSIGFRSGASFCEHVQQIKWSQEKKYLRMCFRFAKFVERGEPNKEKRVKKCQMKIRALWKGKSNTAMQTQERD